MYTWGKGLEMQLGHGNKKEQEEPHQLFEPSATIWRHVSCGNDFVATDFVSPFCCYNSSSIRKLLLLYCYPERWLLMFSEVEQISMRSSDTSILVIVISAK